ncbi:maker180 [Drosophila busckii]|uniref:Maker180 n=1 Tax=Drosophila busckii TaxID=30019 RepID=A0A0M4ET01_DROBS|nr:maker180 [Drosophila busckii]
MMLLPSGRSNSDVYPLPNASTTANSVVGVSKPLLLTRTSSPQLTTATTTTLSNGGANINAYTHSCANGPAAAALEAAGSLPETGTQAKATATTAATTTDAVNAVVGFGPILGQAKTGNGSIAIGTWIEVDQHLEAVQEKLKVGWTVHVGKEGRLYYCK